VLDCGCGTGRLSAALARDGAQVVGVDAEERMLEVARYRLPPDVRLELARVEDLPFQDASFDGAVMWLVCHLVDRLAAFRELRRVLVEGGCLAVVSFDPTHFDEFWLNRYFPSLEAIDRARFPTRQRLAGELATAGFEGVRFLRRSQRASLSRRDAIERIERGHISTFDLIDPDEVERGRERARRELPATVVYALEWLVAVARS
jgi:ubiquinone/menaquinone biosynthesis C-methylase UbiE